MWLFEWLIVSVVHFIVHSFHTGLAIYTGKETKMALNQKEKVSKFSNIER